MRKRDGRVKSLHRRRRRIHLVQYRVGRLREVSRSDRPRWEARRVERSRICDVVHDGLVLLVFRDWLDSLGMSIDTPSPKYGAAMAAAFVCLSGRPHLVNVVSTSTTCSSECKVMPRFLHNFEIPPSPPCSQSRLATLGIPIPLKTFSSP